MKGEINLNITIKQQLQHSEKAILDFLYKSSKPESPKERILNGGYALTVCN